MSENLVLGHVFQSPYSMPGDDDQYLDKQGQKKVAEYLQTLVFAL